MEMFNLFGFESANINTLSEWTGRKKKKPQFTFLNLFFKFVDQDFNFKNMST